MSDNRGLVLSFSLNNYERSEKIWIGDQSVTLTRRWFESRFWINEYEAWNERGVWFQFTLKQRGKCSIRITTPTHVPIFRDRVKQERESA